MSLLTAIVILRLGCFTVGCVAYGVASHMGWPYSWWLLVPTIIAGVMCASLMVGNDDDEKQKKPA